MLGKQQRQGILTHSPSCDCPTVHQLPRTPSCKLLDQPHVPPVVRKLSQYLLLPEPTTSTHGKWGCNLWAKTCQVPRLGVDERLTPRRSPPKCTLPAQGGDSCRRILLLGAMGHACPILTLPTSMPTLPGGRSQSLEQGGAHGDSV